MSRCRYDLLLWIVALSCVAVAQTSLSGAIAGIVRDGQHAVVAHAAIQLQNAESGQSFAAITGSDGRFRVDGLRPGTYALHAVSPGFAGFGPLTVVVEVGRITEVPIDFAVAAVHESIEVREEVPAINTVQPDFASNIDDAAIENLPSNGRRWSNYALLTPTATLDGDFGLISFRGLSGLLNNNTVDGADNNQAFFSEERGRTRISYVISQESVREFQVNTSNFSAEYGRAAGAVVNAVTRSGSNRMHGSAFYFVRDNTLGATDPFTEVPVRQADGQWMPQKFKPLDRRQQFGVRLGGPIKKDKLFYFVNFDAQRRDYPAVAAANVPTSLFAKPCVTHDHYTYMSASNRAQVHDCGDNDSVDELYTLQRNVMWPRIVPQPNGQDIDSNSIAVFQGGLNYLASLLGPVPRTADHQIELAKFDYHIDERNVLGLAYHRLRFSSPGGVQTGPVVNRGIASFGYNGVKVDTLTARLTSLLGATRVNELRYSWSRNLDVKIPQPPAQGEPVGPSGFAPSVAVLDFSSGFAFGAPNSLPAHALPDEYRNDIAETMSWIHHRHAVKFGFDANRVVDTVDNLYAANGSYYYDRRDNFIADLCQWRGEYAPAMPFSSYCPINPGYPSYGAPTQYRGYSSYVQGYGTPAFSFHTFDGALFVQDDWRALPRLTLGFGLRYELELLPAPQMPNPLLPGSQSFPNDLNNFGPRFGFAISLSRDGKTSLRGGYGLYYGRIANSLISSALVDTGTQAAQRSYSYKACYMYDKVCNAEQQNLVAPFFPNVYPSSADPYLPTNGGNVAVFAPHMQTPQVHQADLILERKISAHTVLSISYLVSLARELPNFVDINLNPDSRVDVTYTFAPDYYTKAQGPYDAQETLKVPVYADSKDMHMHARLDPNFQSITQIRSNVNSSYHAVVVQLNRASTRGLGFRIHYTWSHALDNGQNSYNFAYSARNHTLSAAPLTYWLDGVVHTLLRPDYGNSNFDIRQRLVASVYWSPRLFHHSQGLLHNVLDHWTVAPIVQISSGRPFSEYVSGNAPPPPGYSLCAGCTGFMGSGGENRLPMFARNSFRSRALYNTDLRLSRRISLGENGRSLEFMAEAFNLFNHLNITNETRTLYRVYGNTLEYDSNFATPTAAANSIYRERELQLGVRAHF